MTDDIQFAALGLSAPVLKAITSLGYERPSPIQAQAIPHLLAGKNLLGVAQTGTGKTAAFALPLLSRFNTELGKPQVLVLTPTRELAIQVAEAFLSYARQIKHFHVAPIYGGQDIRGQLRILQRGADVVVGTPGRILDHIRRRSLKLNNLQTVVLDEADEMLRMGFIDDVESILGEAPAHCQRALFSATMPAPIRRVVNQYLGDAEEVSIAAKTRTAEKIDQQYLIVHHRQKLDTLTRILEVEQADGLLIFVRTKSSTLELAERLEARGFSAHALNGDLSQAMREQTVNRFKRGDIDIIVATDVAARGLDVERVSHVINFDIPYDSESYVHRIGRTGRAGRDGKAILFVTPKERRLLKAIEKANRQPMKSMSLPSGEQISQQRVARFQSELLADMQGQDLSRFRELVEQLAHDTETDIGEIAAALIWKAQQKRPLFPEFEKPPQDKANPANRGGTEGKPARSEKSSPRKQRTSGDKVKNDLKMLTYRIEAGAAHDVQPCDIVGALANEAGIDGEYIGHIDIHDEFSTVDLPEGMPKEIFQHLKKVRVRQQAMKISLLTSNGDKETTTNTRETTGRKPQARARVKSKPKFKKSSTKSIAAGRNASGTKKSEKKASGKKSPQKTTPKIKSYSKKKSKKKNQV